MKADTHDGPTRAYFHIRERILDQTYQPGQRLRTQEIAEAVGVSRTPIRQALGQLEENGLVQKTDWGFVVRTMTLADIEDLFKVREVLELEAAREARLHVDPAWVAQLRAILARSREFLEQGRHIDSIRAARALHMGIARRSGNNYLVKMLQGIDDQVQMVGAVLIRRHPQRAGEVLAENTAIVQALADGDGTKLAAAIRHHIRRSLKLHLSSRQTLHSG